MVAIFCRVTAELAPDFIVNFPRQFDFTGMLSKICEDVGVDISFQNESFVLHGDWFNIGRTYNMLVSTLAVYGNASAVYKEHTSTIHHGSRPFTALVEAAEAISRGVELQEQVQNELTQINNLVDTSQSENFSTRLNRYSDHQYENATSYQQDSVNDQEDASECSTQEIHEDGDDRNMNDSINLEVSRSEIQEYVNPLVLSNKESKLPDFNSTEKLKYQDTDPRSEISSSQSCKTDELINESKLIDGYYPNFLRCKTCDFTAKSKQDLSEHRCLFHKNQVVKCDICDKIFANVAYMKRHLKRHKDINFTCLECGKKYKDLKTLSEHQKTHIKDYVKPEYKCENCPKSFCSAYKRECHFKSEHLGMKKVFLCQTCGKSFTTNKTLQQHVNSHKGIKPYECSKCGKCFTYESALNDHLFIHVEAKTFLCEYPDCKKAFRQRSALKMHEKIHKNPNQFECSQCGRGFTQKQALQRHLRSHKGLKPFRCKHCGRRFGDASIIRRHMKLVHKLNKDVDKWREDVIEENTEDIESDKEKDASDSPQSSYTEVTVLEAVQTAKDCAYSSSTENISQTLKENDVQIVNSDPEGNSGNVQNVFVTFNLPSQNLVLTNAAPPEFQQSSSQLLQYQFKAEEAPESVDRSTGKLETVNSKSEEDLLQSETDFMEKEQIQFLTENLDGTFNTTVDFSKLKRNIELLTKPSTSMDVNMSNDQTADSLKPDGTEAELPLHSSPENSARFGELETLSDSLGLSVSQFQSCYYNLGNQ